MSCNYSAMRSQIMHYAPVSLIYVSTPCINILTHNCISTLNNSTLSCNCVLCYPDMPSLLHCQHATPSSPMDRGPPNLSTQASSKQLVCACWQYCEGKPCLLSEATFYCHLAEAEQDEKCKLKAIKFASLNAARMILANRPSLQNHPGLPSDAPGLSRGMSAGAHWTTTLQALAKRSQDDPDSQRHAGKHKCAHNKKNIDPLNVSDSRLVLLELLLTIVYCRWRKQGQLQGPPIPSPRTFLSLPWSQPSTFQSTTSWWIAADPSSGCIPPCSLSFSHFSTPSCSLLLSHSPSPPWHACGQLLSHPPPPSWCKQSWQTSCWVRLQTPPTHWSWSTFSQHCTCGPKRYPGFYYHCLQCLAWRSNSTVNWSNTGSTMKPSPRSYSDQQSCLASQSTLLLSTHRKTHMNMS